MNREQIIERLQQNELLKDVPLHDLQWLADHGVVKQIAKGEYLFSKGDPVDEMLVFLEGSLELTFVQNGKHRMMGNMTRGEITGLLPYSRIKEAAGYGKVIEDMTLLELHRDHFTEMICDHHDLVQTLVSFMTTRVRNFTKLQEQNERMMSLGKLSAGLAHELNNPASAIVRSSSALKKHLSHVPDKFKRVISMRLEPEQIDALNGILFEKIQKAQKNCMSLMQRTEREDEISDWLEDHGMGGSYEIAESFTEFNITTDDLDDISKQISNEYLPAVLEWLDNVMTTEKMVAEIEDASERISSLVTSIKTYSHMDRDADREDVLVDDGIRSTLTMLGHKIKHNKVKVVEHYEEGLPKVSAYVGELNQVWTNLIDNALDAMEAEGGTLTIKTFLDKGFVKISIADTGTGIPTEVIDHIFDPFFTTKDVGKGTGLGLDVVHKIIDQHNADIKVTSEPGNTIFTVCIPAA